MAVYLIAIHSRIKVYFRTDHCLDQVSDFATRRVALIWDIVLEYWLAVNSLGFRSLLVPHRNHGCFPGRKREEQELQYYSPSAHSLSMSARFKLTRRRWHFTSAIAAMLYWWRRDRCIAAAVPHSPGRQAGFSSHWQCHVHSGCPTYRQLTNEWAEWWST